jgi:hypothetical protein
MGRDHQRTGPPIAGPPSDQPAYSEDGVDLTLIRWMLRLTPAERLAVLSSHARGLDALKNARFKG